MINAFKGVDGFDGLFYAMPLVDLPKLAKEARSEKVVNNDDMRSTVSLNNSMVEFDYIQEFDAINSSLLLYNSFASIREKLLSYNGLFPRFYWGKVRVTNLGGDFANVRSEHVIVSINLSDINSPMIRYYFVESESSKVYEHLKSDKALNKMKSSRAEIIKINNKIMERTVDELEVLKSEVFK